MFKKIVFSLLVVCVPTLTEAFDFTDFYLKGTAGLNFLSMPSSPNVTTETKTGCAVGGSLGYRFPMIVRIEGEMMYRYNDLDYFLVRWEGRHIPVEVDGKVSSLTCMGNVLFDFPKIWTLPPYIGGGLGGCFEWSKGYILPPDETLDVLRFKGKRSGFVYQVIAGVKMLRSQWIDAGIEYHFVDFVASKRIYNHTFAIMGCYRF